MDIRTINTLANGTSSIERIAAGLSLLDDAKNLFNKAKAWHQAKTTWMVRINSSDPNYRAVEDWLMERIPQVDLHSVVATSVRYVELKDGTEMSYEQYRNDTEVMLDNINAAPYQKFVTSVGTTQTHTDVIDGHPVVVKIFPNGVEADDILKSLQQENQESGGIGRRRSNTSATARAEASIVFYVRSLAGRSAILQFLNSFAATEKKKSSTLYFANSWGEWSGSSAPSRTLDSVILRDGIVEDLRSDLQKFLDDESKYTRLGIPYHRGYLLHGPPGTGKTSMVKALSSELGLDLWYLSMGDVKDDGGLMSMIRSVREGGILLLEDVDSFAPVLTREEGQGAQAKKNADDGVSTSALLNALDGVATPHGLITIMTTNYLDRLDPAVLRSGRVDKLVELALPTWSEVQRLWTMFYKEAGVETGDLGDEPDWFAGSGVSQADVSEIFKRFWEDPETARLELMAGAFVR